MFGMTPAVMQGLQDLRDRQAGKTIATIEMTEKEFMDYAKKTGMDSLNTNIALNFLKMGAAIGAGRCQQIKLKNEQSEECRT